MLTTKVLVLRWVFSIFWLAAWLTGAAALWGHPQAWWFAYLCIALAPLPALYDGWRTYNHFKSRKRKP